MTMQGTEQSKRPQRTLFGGILEVHHTWWLEKGYDERMLGSSAPQNALLEDFRRAIGAAVVARLWVPGPQGFQVTITGSFGGGKDNVLFSFYYEYYPDTIKLNLLKMTGSMGEYFQEYKISQNTRHQLPVADNVYLLLQAKKTLKEGQSSVSDKNQPPAHRVHAGL